MPGGHGGGAGEARRPLPQRGGGGVAGAGALGPGLAGRPVGQVVVVAGPGAQQVVQLPGGVGRHRPGQAPVRGAQVRRRGERPDPGARPRGGPDQPGAVLPEQPRPLGRRDGRVGVQALLGQDEQHRCGLGPGRARRDLEGPAPCRPRTGRRGPHGPAQPLARREPLGQGRRAAALGGREVGDHLLQREGVPADEPVQGSHHRRLHVPGEQRRRRLGPQRREPQPGQPRQRAGVGVRAHEQGHGVLAQAAPDERQRRRRRRVEVLGVVEEDHQRRLGGRGGQQRQQPRRHQERGRSCPGLGRGPAQRSGQGGPLGPRDPVQVGPQGEHEVQQPGVGEVGVGAAQAHDPGVAGLGDRSLGDRGLSGRHPGGRPHGARGLGARALGGKSLGDRGLEQGRDPGAGLAEDAQGTAAPGDRVREQGPQLRRLAVPADEHPRRLATARRRRSRDFPDAVRRASGGRWIHDHGHHGPGRARTHPTHPARLARRDPTHGPRPDRAPGAR